MSTADKSFALGEITILAVALSSESVIGEEREITGLPQPFKDRSPSGRLYGPWTYSVRRPNGEYGQAYSWQLRKKRCPEETQSRIAEREQVTS